MFEVTLLGIFFKSCWNGEDWSGFNIVKNVIETTHTSLMLLIIHQLSVLGPWMLSFPYEQRIWILSGLPQINKFTVNRLFAKHHLQFFVFVTFIMGIGYQNIGWFYIHMYISFAVQVWLSQKPKTRNTFLGFLFIASRALHQRYAHCNRPL